MDTLESQKKNLEQCDADGCCDFCGEEHETNDCPQLQTSQKIDDTEAPSRAELTLPSNLKLLENGDWTFKVVAKTNIDRGVQFGPFEAPRVQKLQTPSAFPLKVFSNGSSQFLDVADKNYCNWMCLVAAANESADQTLIAYQLQDDIFFCTKKNILPGEELRVGYSIPYGKKLAKSLEDEPTDLSGQPEKKKRGRPPKKTKPQKKSPEKCDDNDLEPAEKCFEESDESVIRNLTPQSLGVETVKKEWQCSQCSAVYRNCYDFAKHLQAHYKPPSETVSRDRGKGKQQNDRRTRSSTRRAEKSEDSAEDDGDNNVQGDKSPEVETSGITEESSVEAVSPKVSSKRGRKRKSEQGEKCPSTKTAVEKRFRAITRERSHFASKKYNLRTSRKTLVFSEDEMDADDSQESDDDDDEYIDSVGEESDDSTEEAMESETVCQAQPKSSMEELLKVAASDILASMTSESPVVSSSDITSSAMSLLALQSLPEKALFADQDGNANFDSEQCKDSAGQEIAIEGADGVVVLLPLVEDTTPNGREASAKSGCELRSGLYKCDLCPKSFEKTVYLYRHMKKHTGEYTCRNCHKVFARKESMLKHACPNSTRVRRSNALACKFCSKAFDSYCLLKRHLTKHTGEFSCSDCGKNYSTKCILLNHSCPVKPTDCKYSCSVCAKNFTKEVYLQKHVPVHTGQHSCPICSKWLRSSDSLTNHMRMCGQVKQFEELGEITCSSCHMIFTDVSLFRRHEYEHTHSHACDTCGARFRNPISLGLHVCQRLTHTCNVCRKVFNGVASLQRHKLNHQEPKFKCDECHRSFFRKDLLLAHSCNKPKPANIVSKSKRKDGELSPYMCELCGSLFSSNSSLTVHKNLHGEKKYICNVCGKRFHRKDLLLEHHAVHGMASFPCPSCNKMFKTKKSLDVHVKLHGGVKRFKCSVCDKMFFQKGNLQKHEETHMKDVKYQCTVCRKNFSTSAYLKIHSLEHTTGRIFHCTKCGKGFVKSHQLLSHVKMFHGNRSFTCKYCDITLKLPHSLKRHLMKKHSDMEHDWKQRDVLKSMLSLKDSSSSNESAAETELRLVSDFTTAQGAEVLLAVAGYGSEELKEAIASGRAHVTQGETPDMIEIAIPYQCDDDDDNAKDGGQSFIEADNDDDESATSNDNSRPLEADEISNIQEEQQLETLDLVQTGYQIALPAELSEAGVATSTEYEMEESDEGVHETITYSTGEELGQNIVISEEQGMHHIVLNASQLEELQSRLQQQEGTVVFEDSASKLLFYVVTDKQA